MWVAGELHRVRHSDRGHLYFELVEKGRGDGIVGKLDAVIWRTDHMRIRRVLRAHEAALREGQRIRCRIQLDFYPPMGRLQAIVRDVDPLFTLGQLALRRAETLAALDAAGLLDKNGALPLSPVPTRLVLITAQDSAAYHDVVSGLKEGGYAFQVLHIAASVQGARAEHELAAAFGRVARLAAEDSKWRPEAVILARGGGARTDLAVFDSRAVAEAVARCPLPVLTGLGHETDETVADRVAHTALKTPTRVAAFVVERMIEAEAAYLTLRTAIVDAARARVESGRRALGRGERVALAAQRRIETARGALREAARAIGIVARGRLRQARGQSEDGAVRVATAAQRRLRRAQAAPEQAARRVAERAGAKVQRLATVIEGHARLCTELSPSRILARGFSITRTADGRVLRQSSDAAPGVRLQTELATGRIESIVTSEENG